MAKKKYKSNHSKNKPQVKSKKRYKNEKVFSRWHAVPLKGSFMASAMLGFFISAYYVYPKTYNFGIAFMIIFGLMFIAAIISMTKAPIVNERY
jgi:hypothetical protein